MIKLLKKVKDLFVQSTIWSIVMGEEIIPYKGKDKKLKEYYRQYPITKKEGRIE